MARNQKLTRVIGGRTIQRARAEPGKLVIRFNDEATMQVKTAAVADIFPPGGKIEAIQEDGADFRLQFEEGPIVSLKLVDPGSSVAVRDKNNRVEYLG